MQKLESAFCWDRKVMYHCFSPQINSPPHGLVSVWAEASFQWNSKLFVNHRLLGGRQSGNHSNPQINSMDDQRRCFSFFSSQIYLMRCILWKQRGCLFSALETFYDVHMTINSPLWASKQTNVADMCGLLSYSPERSIKTF